MIKSLKCISFILEKIFVHKEYRRFGLLFIWEVLISSEDTLGPPPFLACAAVARHGTFQSREPDQGNRTLNIAVFGRAPSRARPCMEAVMGTPTPADAGKTIRVDLGDDLARQLDAWRRPQDRVPSTAAAVRSLLSRSPATEHTTA